ncbi:MAG: hypothetical protein QM786_12045 [Breznakibacter sp.]
MEHVKNMMRYRFMHERQERQNLSFNWLSVPVPLIQIYRRCMADNTSFHGCFHAINNKLTIIGGGPGHCFNDLSTIFAVEFVICMSRMFQTGVLLFASVYMVLAIGMPIYQIHCRTSGETRTNLLVQFDSCESMCAPTGQHEQPDCCSCHHPNEHSRESGQYNQDCNETKVGILKYNGLQDRPTTLQHKYLQPQAVDLWVDLSHFPITNILCRDLKTIRDVGRPVGSLVQFFASSNQFLNFICQRKESLSVA